MDIKKLTKNQKILILVVSVLAVVFIGIVTVYLVLKQNGSTGNNNNNNSNNIEITYWGLWEPDEVMHPLIEKYEAEHPGVTILYSQQAFKNYETRVYTRLQQSDSSSEPAPDIVRINNSWLPKFRQYLTSLPESVMDKSTYSSEFYPVALSDFTGSDGKIYAIPWEIDGLSVFYNKQLLEDAEYTEPPTDWDSFMEAAVKLTKKDEDTGKITQAGVAIGTSKNINHSADIVAFLMLQNSVELMNSTRTETSLTSTRAVSAMTQYTDFATGDNATWATYLENDLVKFYKGELAMMFAPSWRAFDIIEAAPQIEFGIAPLPQLPNNDPVYYAMYWGDSVSSSCENPEVAWDFIEFLSEPEQQRRLFSNSSQIRAFGEPYSRVSMKSELEANPYTKAYAEMAAYMKSWNVGDQTFAESLIRDGITDIVENDSGVESVLKSIETDINDQLAQTNK